MPGLFIRPKFHSFRGFFAFFWPAVGFVTYQSVKERRGEETNRTGREQKRPSTWVGLIDFVYWYYKDV